MAATNPIYAVTIGTKITYLNFEQIVCIEVEDIGNDINTVEVQFVSKNGTAFPMTDAAVLAFTNAFAEWQNHKYPVS